MFVRRIDVNLKPNTLADFKRTVETEVMPLLKKQEGFLHQMTMVEPNSTKGFGLSLWKTRDAAENYNRTIYPQVTKMLEKFFEGAPKVMHYEMAHSTLNVPLAANA